jgi:hypothetical protein
MPNNFLDTAQAIGQNFFPNTETPESIEDLLNSGRLDPNTLLGRTVLNRAGVYLDRDRKIKKLNPNKEEMNAINLRASRNYDIAQNQQEIEAVNRANQQQGREDDPLGMSQEESDRQYEDAYKQLVSYQKDLAKDLEGTYNRRYERETADNWLLQQAKAALKNQYQDERFYMEEGSNAMRHLTNLGQQAFNNTQGMVANLLQRRY